MKQPHAGPINPRLHPPPPPSRGDPRGNALISVLAISGVLFLLSFVVASICMADLDFASSFRTHVQDEQLARAAIAQFTYEADQATVNNSPLESSPSTDWAARYAGAPVFPDGGSHLPGTVSITFKPSAPYHSVDNSQSSLPAAGWSDRGTSKLSVPPYSVSLVMQTQTGSQRDAFEAIIQRRWPYVLTTPGPIREVGTFGSPISGLGGLSGGSFGGALSGSSGSAWSPDPVLVSSLASSGSAMSSTTSSTSPASLTSAVNGGVYCLNGNLTIPDPSIGQLNPPPISNQLAKLLANLQPPQAASNQLVVGGQISDGVQTLNSIDNSLQGNVDFCAPAGAPAGVSVSASNQWTGSSRFSVWTNRDLTRLSKLLVMPGSTGFTPISPPELVEEGTANPANPAQTEPFLMLVNNLTLGSAGAVSGPLFSNPTKILINESMGNLRLAYHAPGSSGAPLLSLDSPITTDYSGKTLELNNCNLYVNGDLVMGNPTALPGSGPGPITLKGSNATVIVNGTLCLSEASIDAQTQGMVILCRYLICQSTGYYRGLIMVQNGAIFYPREDPSLTPLELHGAMVIGGTGSFPSQSDLNSEAQLSQQQLNDSSSGLQQWLSERVSSSGAFVPGMTIWSSQLIYEPRYLPTLHGLGYSELLSLRRLP